MNDPDYSEFAQVAASLYAAIAKLLNEPKLFTFKINERTLTQRLSLHLQPFFKDFSVDCEYNRQWAEDCDLVKRLAWKSELTETDDIEGKTVYPDIIVHVRGEKTPNLLVIEAKRDAEQLKATDKDYLKLSAFTDQDGKFKYIWGAHINFLTLTHGAKRPAAHVIWFKNRTVYGVPEDVYG